ncbi:MAG: glycan-binding surface protein [Cyclobacteriaceae bacterium]
MNKVFAMILVFILVSCQDEDGVSIVDTKGIPSISYVRVGNPDKSDSLLVRADLGSEIVIVGTNLGGTRQVWFNDRQALVTPTWVTNTNILVQVPSIAPVEVTNSIYLVDSNSDTLKYAFEVSISPPEIDAAINEWPQAGENLVVTGNFFFEPITISFTGGVTGDLVSISQDRVEFTIPEGATEGPVTITTNFGEAESGFHLWDTRNVILNFDDLQPNAWRIGQPEIGDGEIDGNYNVFRGNIGANVRDEGPGAPATSPLLFEYWGGYDPDRTENFFPTYPNSYQDYVLKFEAKVNNWYGGYLNICLSTPEHADNNQEIWSNDNNARAIWGPWAEEDQEFSTDGQWITVVIPLSDFQYFMEHDDDLGVFYTSGHKFVEAAAGSMSMWLIGSPENSENPVEFYVDNLRIVLP